MDKPDQTTGVMVSEGNLDIPAWVEKY